MRLCAYERFERFKYSNPTMHGLVRFHTEHKFLLQSHNEILYRQLGNIVSNHDNDPFEEVVCRYGELFKEALTHESSIRQTRNVLEHMAGFFKHDLSSEEKALLHEQIRSYAENALPLSVPLSTIRLYATKYHTRYLLGQRIFDLCPDSEQ